MRTLPAQGSAQMLDVIPQTDDVITCTNQVARDALHVASSALIASLLLLRVSTPPL
jgi:hypothetical protein